MSDIAKLDWFDFIDKLNKKENRMTREEAINIASKVCNKPYPEANIAILEALGLIKFEEKKSAFDIICDTLPMSDINRTYSAIIIKRLQEYGYLK